MWLASWVYLERVADQVVCATVPDGYHRHLHFLRKLLVDYPCSKTGQRRSVALIGLAYFAVRPHVAIRWHAMATSNGIAELADAGIFLLNAVFCLSALLLSGTRPYRLVRRVFIVGPVFIHHLCTLLPLLVSPQGGVPSPLARLVPLRPMFVLYLALAGAHCWEVAAASAVAFGSTVATTALLLRAGVPIHYRPVRVTLHIVLASLAGMGWAALWDGLLPDASQLWRLGVGPRPAAPSASPPVSRAHGGDAAPRGRMQLWGGFLPATTDGEGSAADSGAGAGGHCPVLDAGLGPLAAAAGVLEAMVAEPEGGKRRPQGGGGGWGRRGAEKGGKVAAEGGGARKRRRRRTAAAAAAEDSVVCLEDSAVDSDAAAATAASSGDSGLSCASLSSVASIGSGSVGRGALSDGPDGDALQFRVANVVASQRLPLWVQSLWRKRNLGDAAAGPCPAVVTAATPAAAAAGSETQTLASGGAQLPEHLDQERQQGEGQRLISRRLDDLSQQHGQQQDQERRQQQPAREGEGGAGVEEGPWSVAAASAAPETRRRFVSQLRRRVLRVRVVGTDPEQLTSNWREVVFAHFDGSSRSSCSVGGNDGPEPRERYLASGVAVRRGSIYLTVSLVQMPSPQDGVEGPSGVGAHQPPWNDDRTATAAAAAAAAAARNDGVQWSGSQPRADLVSMRASSGCGAVAEAPAGPAAEAGSGQGQGGQGVDGCLTAAAERPVLRTAPQKAEQPLQHQSRAHRLRLLLRIASAGAERRLSGSAGRHLDAAAAAAVTCASSVDGHSGDHENARAPMHGAESTASTPGSFGADAAAIATAADAAYPPSSGRDGHLSPRMQPANAAAPAAAGIEGGGNTGPGLYGMCGGIPGRRRITGVWHAERLGAFPSGSPASTPGNSNNPLQALGPTAAAAAAASSLWSVSPVPAGLAGPGLPAGSPAQSASGAPAPWLGQGQAPPGGGVQPPPQTMRYTPMLSPAQQAALCCGLGPYGAPPSLLLTAGSRSYVTDPLLPQMYHLQQQQQQHHHHTRSGAAASTLTHGSLLRTAGGGGEGGSSAAASASMQVAQLLDAMQLRSSREHATTIITTSTGSREAAQALGCVPLSAVSQLDGGRPQRLRQALATEGWEPGDDAAFSSSWEVDGVYERPASPPLMPLRQQAQMRRWAEEMGQEITANGLFALPDAMGGPTASGGGLGPLLQQQQQHMAPQAAAGAAAAGLDLSGGLPLADVVRSAGRGPGRTLPGGGGGTVGYPATLAPPYQQQQQQRYAQQQLHQSASPAWASPPAVRPSHTAGLAVLADPATLAVQDVAVKPILICKAPLLHAAAAGDLAACIPVPTPAATATSAAVPASELELSLICAPATVSELSVMLRYCGPTSVFGEQIYLPVQLQLDSSSPAVAAAVRLQAASSDRDHRGGGDTQAARDVTEAATDPLPAHAIVRTALEGLACPGVLYVELWHGPQLCACLPVLLLPESAAGWAHEVCSLWQQQAEEGEAAAALGGVVAGRAGAAAMPAAAHQVVEDLGGWLTYAAHMRVIAERAAVVAAAAAAATSSPSYPARGPYRVPPYHQSGSVAEGSLLSSATATTLSPHQAALDEWFSGWLAGNMSMADAAAAAVAAATTSPYAFSPPPLPPPPPALTPPLQPPATAGAGHDMPYDASYDTGGYDGAAAAAAACNRELFHDMMLQEGYNWLADCVEAGCVGLAAALMDSLLAAGCGAADVLRTCRSADGLPLTHAATLSGNPAMLDLVWGWGRTHGIEALGWSPAPPAAAPPAPAPPMPMPPALTSGGGRLLTGRAAAGASNGTGAGGAGEAAATAQRTAAGGRDAVSAQRDFGAAAWRLPSLCVALRAAGGGIVPSAAVRCVARATRHAASRLATVQLAGSAALTWRRGRCGGGSAGRGTATAIASAVSSITQAAVAATRSPRLGGCRTGGDCRDAWCLMWWRRQRIWQRSGAAAQRAGLALLRGADATVAGLHSLVLRANVALHLREEEEGAEERRFLSYFQQRHGWVFSAWCWSMVPLYGIVAARCVAERQWGHLALTPLWMWMYPLCATADLVGATAAYRGRTEALAAAMHLSHSLSKALCCAGLPSYPLPDGPGRLYWLDVLACATLSALCEPVRICVAWPLRAINFGVSTVLYRVTGTAPSLTEAALLSASCHCFGLLMQHAVESYYRRGFAAAGQRAAAAVGAAATAKASPHDGGGGAAVATGLQEEVTARRISFDPPPLPHGVSPRPLARFDSMQPASSPPPPPAAAACAPELDTWAGSQSAALEPVDEVVTAAVAAAASAAATAATAAAVTAAAQPPQFRPGFRGFTEPVDSDRESLILTHDCDAWGHGGEGAQGGGDGGWWRRRSVGQLCAPVADSRGNNFLLSDGVWLDGGGAAAAAWSCDSCSSLNRAPPSPRQPQPTSSSSSLPLQQHEQQQQLHGGDHNRPRQCGGSHQDQQQRQSRPMEASVAPLVTPSQPSQPQQQSQQQRQQEEFDTCSHTAEGDSTRRLAQLVLSSGCDATAGETAGLRASDAPRSARAAPRSPPRLLQQQHAAGVPTTAAAAASHTAAVGAPPRSAAAAAPMMTVAASGAAVVMRARGSSSGDGINWSDRLSTSGVGCVSGRRMRCGGCDRSGAGPGRRRGDDDGCAAGSNIGNARTSSSSGGGRGGGGGLRQVLSRAAGWVAGALRRRSSLSAGRRAAQRG